MAAKIIKKLPTSDIKPRKRGEIDKKTGKKMNWILPPSKLMNSGLPNDVRLARAKRENELKDILADTSSFKVFLTSQLGFGPKFGAWTKITQIFGSGNFYLKFCLNFFIKKLRSKIFIFLFRIQFFSIF